MKSLILLLFVLGLTFSSKAQETFTVIKVVGIVQHQQLNRLIRTGDKLKTKDALLFNSKDSYIILLGPKSGRKIIREVPDNSPHEFYQLLQTFVKPDRKSTATRATTYLGKLKQLFTYDTLLILGDGRIRIETSELSMAAPAGIRVTYKDAEKYIHRKISDDKSFSLNKNSLFDSPPPEILPRVSIHYYQDESDDPLFSQGEKLGDFVPMFVTEQIFKTEIDAIVQSMSVNKTSQENLVAEIRDYIEAEYADIIPENLRDWLTATKLISK